MVERETGRNRPDKNVAAAGTAGKGAALMWGVQVPGLASGETQFVPERSALIAAGMAVAATYFYFLLFAEFALLELARPLTAGAEWRLRGLMTTLGVGGVAGSLFAAWRFQLIGWQHQVSWGFRACAVAAALALGATVWPLMLLSALVCGLSLGWLTVILASGLRPVIGTRRLGLTIGAGTGAAYALCNLPGVFEASARGHTIVAALVAATASILSPFLAPQEPSVSPEYEYKPVGVVRWLILLAVLVALDSAVFYVIQQVDDLKAVTWSGAGRLWGNAAVHLGAALLAGRWLDRGGRIGPLALGFLLLAGGSLWLGGGGGGAGWVYAAGVSLYSTVLVYYPARSGRVWQAAVICAGAGWIGSGIGIGLAQNLTAVPTRGVLIAAGVFAAVAIWRWQSLRTAGAAGAEAGR